MSACVGVFLFCHSCRLVVVGMDVKAYLERIGYDGALDPNLKNLRSISYAHKMSVPYTSLEMYGGRKITLDVEDMYRKIVTENGGGICYEINYLFCWLLEKLGFDAQFHPAEFFHDFFGGFSPDHQHMIPLVTIDGNKYLVDPGWLTIGPMKIEMMLPYVETHGVYRVRQMYDREGWLYMERHKKTVLDAKGNMLKQGPGKCVDGYCDEECAKEESSHWTFLFRFDTKAAKIQDFEERLEFLQTDETSVLYQNACLIAFGPKTSTMLFSDSIAIKESIDPNTDKIVEEFKVSNDNELAEVSKSHFGCAVVHKLNFFSHYKKK